MMKLTDDDPTTVRNIQWDTGNTKFAKVINNVLHNFRVVCKNVFPSNFSTWIMPNMLQDRRFSHQLGSRVVNPCSDDLGGQACKLNWVHALDNAVDFNR